jgi:A/G-specific adenine glycosylase
MVPDLQNNPEWFKDPKQLGEFHSRLIKWGKENFRDYPWRKTKDPYRILIAEVMLHRTQAKQVLPVYESFISQYSDIQSLSKATIKELDTSLFSLGLKWRTDYIYRMVYILEYDFQGKVPKDKETLLSLPGVSEYIAGAVRCFAWGFPEPLIDTNIVRIVGRIFGLEIKQSSRRNPIFRERIELLLSKVEPESYNYALLDLGDKICTKRKVPKCFNCPIVNYCKFGKILLEN